MAKYKVGEEVGIKRGKMANMTLFITQVEEVTCTAGKQTTYTGRLWQNALDRPEIPMCVKTQWQFNEIELEAKNEKEKDDA